MVFAASETEMHTQLFAAGTAPPGGSGDCLPAFTYTKYTPERWARGLKSIPDAGWETFLLTSASTFILNIRLLLHLTATPDFPQDTAGFQTHPVISA